MPVLPFASHHACPPAMAQHEWQARVGLAACYRLFDFLGWTEGIYNHITLRLGETAGTPTFLINPYGLHYAEVTPHNLVVVDADGRVVGDSTHPVNAAGMVIHTAVHRARADAHCVMHTHTTSIMAVSCKEAGLRGDNFYSAQLVGRLAYHDFEGITTRPDEGVRLVADLGDRPLMLLRNHGVLAVGDTLCSTFALLWQMQRACDVQLAADSMAGPNRAIASQVLAQIADHVPAMRPAGARAGEMLFNGLLRRAGITLDNLLQNAES